MSTVWKRPWELACQELRSPHGEVLDGPWPWRKFVLPDGSTGGVLVGFLRTLIHIGEEFAVTAYRAHSGDGSFALEYRVVLVTWGAYLDLREDEVLDRMQQDNGNGGTGGSMGSTVPAQRTDGQATEAARWPFGRWPKPLGQGTDIGPQTDQDGS